MFLKPYSYYKYGGDNLQHSVVSNNETQLRNSRAVALSTRVRLRFSSSMSSVLGGFESCYKSLPKGHNVQMSKCLTLTGETMSRNGQRQAWWPECV